MQEMLTLIIQIVKERRFCGLTTTESLKRELIYKLAIGNATHSQLVKSLPQDLSKISQLQEILDAIAVYSEPSGVNQVLIVVKKISLIFCLDLYLNHYVDIPLNAGHVFTATGILERT